MKINRYRQALNNLYSMCNHGDNKIYANQSAGVLGELVNPRPFDFDDLSEQKYVWDDVEKEVMICKMYTDDKGEFIVLSSFNHSDTLYDRDLFNKILKNHNRYYPIVKGMLG